MKAIICDRCDKVFEPKKIRLIRINKMIDVTNVDGGYTEAYDVCEECYIHMFSYKSEGEQ